MLFGFFLLGLLYDLFKVNPLGLSSIKIFLVIYFLNILAKNFKF